ncbi:hypothetical protein MCOR20_000589 [Pyricularia oryzae]|nr:hypothetical protein MCOR20_000589 [Pyricularia oryzae]
MFGYLIRVEARLSDPHLLRGTWWKMAAQLTYDGSTGREMLATCLNHLIGPDTKPRLYTSLLRRVVNMCIISSGEPWWKVAERLRTSWYYLGGYTAVALVRAVHARSARLVKFLLDNGADLHGTSSLRKQPEAKYSQWPRFDERSVPVFRAAIVMAESKDPDLT